MFASVLMWLCVVGVVVYLLLTEPDPDVSRQHSWISAVFFLSGFPALIYQIVWQRALFVAFGSNIESVTIVVTAFILGLGLGSLAGGWVSARTRAPLAWFGCLELCVALFGAASLSAFRLLAEYTTSLSTPQTAVIATAVLIVPTALMGASLPFLVSHFVLHCGGSVGRSVAALYFVNTLGSALACFICAHFAMHYLGESGTVALACVINLGVATVTLMRRPVVVSGETMEPQFPPRPRDALPYSAAVILAALSGFVALGYEILWYRIYAIAESDKAPVFASLLGAYLLGLAFGALVTETRCRGKKPAAAFSVSSVGWLLVAFNVISFAVVPAVAVIARWINTQIALLLVAVAAGCLGSAFPMIAQFSIQPRRDAGFRLGGLYFSNMLGSALGSIAIGFVIMNFLPLPKVGALLLFVGMGSGILVLASQREGRQVALSILIAIAAAMSVRPLYRNVYEKLLFAANYRDGMRLKHVVENRNGVIFVTDGDAVYGNGVYDGRFNVDLVQDSNGIFRCYAIPAFHPEPREVLVIGLSSGSWAQVLAEHPAVQHLTAVEINPGYLQLISMYREVEPLVHNPKVEIVIDDARRWLRAHPERKFDLIVMNTSFHWRAHSTNLLSSEFLQSIRPHLQPGGVLFYNTTSSPSVQRTGVTVFRYGVRVANFLAVSDSPLRLDGQRLRKVLAEYRVNGKPVLSLDREEDAARLKEMLSMLTPVTDSDQRITFSTEFADSIRKRTQRSRIITDDNMGDEW